MIPSTIVVFISAKVRTIILFEGFPSNPTKPETESMLIEIV